MTELYHKVNRMRLFLLLSIPSLAFAVPASSVEDDIHKKCIAAADYRGCVEVLSGKESRPERVIMDQGIAVNEGNECPYGYGYKGGGYCQEIVCNASGLLGTGHDPTLAAKGHACKKTSIRLGSNQLGWGKDVKRATVNKDCPDVPLGVGWTSTCIQRMFIVSDEVLGFGDLRVDTKDPSDQGNSVVYKAANIRRNKWFWLGISCEKNKVIFSDASGQWVNSWKEAETEDEMSMLSRLCQ